jgi:branched-chain amino acid aminotransferase
LIWHSGEIMPDDSLRISVLDRTFEHGLGIFETLRTWNGHPTLLERHLDRMKRSARELGLSVDPSHLPDAPAADKLIKANQASLTSGHDVRLRITVSGGSSDPARWQCVAWMSVSALPPQLRESGAFITHEATVIEDDPLARHKTLNYWRKRLGQERAAACGSDDALYLTPAGLICETSRANIFLIEGGRLHTPSADGPLLPGVMRTVVIEHAQRMGLGVVLEPLPRERIATADEAFLTNSVRGMLPIARLPNRQLPAPGPVTRQLWAEIVPWLETGGTTP